MAKSPIFLFMVVLLVAAAFVMVVTAMQSNAPAGDPYTNTSSSVNGTQAFIKSSMDMAPNWVIPGVFVTLAILLIGVLLLVAKRT